MSDQSLLDRVAAWIEQDPDPQTSQALTELSRLVIAGDQGSANKLNSLFGEHLRFGTAGLRGELGPGPSRMNRVVVSHAANGLGRFLLARSSDTPLHVVVGFDARHNSDVFASDTAEILSGMGIRVSLFSHTTPTPVLAFALRHLGADAGVMVTASHNPPGDNGYKLYLGGADNGSQITSPTDAAIHRQIVASHETTSANNMVRNADLVTPIGQEVEDAYLRDTREALNNFPHGGLKSLRVCYTPLHGVGRDITLKMFAQLGIGHVSVVASQADPDPLFPTVSYPNPEEAGALDAAYATATAESCDLIIAHDPDADRLAVAIPDATSDHGWRMLSGNHLGAILLAAVAENGACHPAGGTLSSSLVSSPIIGKIAEKNGLEHWECPTGFKWISRAPGIVAGFEEALGYLVTPHVVSDKDGISAAALALMIAGEAKQAGGSLDTVLAQLMDTYGAFASDQVTLRLASATEAAAVMSALRSSTHNVSARLHTSDVVDFLTDSGEFPPADMVRFSSNDGGRVIFRPSGTEPKLKVYVDAFGPTPTDASRKVRQLTSSAEGAVAMLLPGADPSP